MKRLMNGYLVGSLLGPFAGLSDPERAELHQHTDPNDEIAVKRMIANVLKPFFDQHEPESQTVLRNNLSYFLTVGSDYWEAIYEMYLPPIDPPRDPRQFFVWLWEVLFPGEDYVMRDVGEVEVKNDISAIGNLRSRATP